MQKTVAIANTELFDSIEPILAGGGRVTLRVKGNSMRPFLRNGRDTVELAALPAYGVRKGMLVLFRYRGGIVLHRVRRIDSGRLTAAGDGNWRQRETFAPDDIIGYARSIRRAGRTANYRSAAWMLLTAMSLSRCAVRRILLDSLQLCRRKRM